MCQGLLICLKSQFDNHVFDQLTGNVNKFSNKPNWRFFEECYFETVLDIPICILSRFEEDQDKLEAEGLKRQLET